MRFSLAAIAALVTSVVATSYTTEIVTNYVTYCPESTTIIHGTETYSVTAPTSLTMSGGPYTISRPLMTSTVTVCAGNCPSSTPASGVVPVFRNGTGSVIPSSPQVSSAVPLASSAAVTSVSVPSGTSAAVAPVYTGGASRAATGAGAGLAVLFGVVALL